jgi:integrase
MLNTISVVDNEQYLDTMDTLGKQQWVVLDALANKYKDTDLSSILHHGRFFDNEWFPNHVQSPETIKFDRLFPNANYYPLELICRIACYKLIVNRGMAQSTVFAYLSTFCNGILKDEGWGNVMIAARDQPFAILSSIEEEFITSYAQARLALSSTLSTTGFHFLNSLQLMNSTDLKTFTSGITMPWTSEGLPVLNWLEQQKEVVGTEEKNEEAKKKEKFYAPLEFEAVSLIVKHSMPFILEHYELLSALFELVRVEYKKSKGAVHKNKIQGASNSAAVSDFIEKHKAVLSGIMPIKYSTSTKRKHISPLVDQKWISDILRTTQSACTWIILLTTGLRNLDMRGLRIGCCKPSKRMESTWWLVADVQKTKNRLVIPVGEPTYKAVKLLENSRTWSLGTFLIASPRHYLNNRESGRSLTENELGGIKAGETFNELLRVIPKRYKFTISIMGDSDSEATAHCVRSTLAGYVAVNSNVAILILKKLFGHSNALMPNEYIRRNPLVIQKRKELLLKHANDMARDMAHATAYKEVGGRSGERLLEGAETALAEIEEEARIENVSLTEMDMRQKLEDRLFAIFHSDILEEETYALMTPMAVVCMRACNNVGDSPCAAASNRQSRADSGIKKAITDALISLPNPAQCVGVGCADALLAKKWSQPLLESFDFYHQYCEGTGQSSTKLENAKVFIDMYAEPLKKVFGDEREEGYFHGIN